MPPSSAKAKHASSAMPMPTTQTVRKSQGCRVLMATSLAVRKMPEPMMPPASNRMESVRESRRTSLASLGNMGTAAVSRLGYNRVFGGPLQGLCANSYFGMADPSGNEGRSDETCAGEFSPVKKTSGEFDGY